MTISKFPLKRTALCVLALPALLALSPASAKTLVFCSEGSPENFAPSINTTGTSFDAGEQIYDNLVDFERGGTKVVPNLAQSWTVSKDGLEYTFNLRKGVKWHSNKNFKPSRDFNADDMLFMFERQWKENDPYFKVTSPNHSYFNDMGMPKLLKSVDKVDDYTVKVTLNAPEAPVPVQSGHAICRRAVQGIRHRDAQGRHAREDRPGADRHRPLHAGAVPEDAMIRYKANPQYWAARPRSMT
jgi:dipeptide transport system substrate-binding protein